MGATSKKIPEKTGRADKRRSSKKAKWSAKSPLFVLLPFIILALSLIVETCLILYDGSGGAAKLVYDLFFGLLGYASHVLVIGAMLIAFFFIELSRRGTLRFKIILTGALTVLAAAFNSLVAVDGLKEAKFSLSGSFKSGALGESGGVFGDILGMIFSRIFSDVLATVIVGIVCAVLITFVLGKSRLGVWRRLIGVQEQTTKKVAPAKQTSKESVKPSVPDIDVAPCRLDTVIGQEQEQSYPELDSAVSNIYGAEQDTAIDLSDFSVSDGRHTIETVDFSKSEQTPEPYKPEDLMKKFGFKEQTPVKTDIYGEATPETEQTPRKKITVSGATGYSPFATVVSEEEFFANAHLGQNAPATTTTVPPTPVRETRAYSPFADPVRSMQERAASHQAHAGSEDEQIWQSMQRQANDIAESVEQKAEQDFAKKTENAYAPIFDKTIDFTSTEEEYAIPGEPLAEDESIAEPSYEREQTEDKITVKDISALNKTGISDFDEGISEPEQEEFVQEQTFEPIKPAPTPIMSFESPKPAPAPKHEESAEINPFGIYNKLRYPKYMLPKTDLLDSADGTVGISENEIYDTQRKLIDILESFGINATLSGYSVGPTITRYELTPGAGVKFKQIANLSEDISVRLQSDKLNSSIRIVTVPGKSVIGVEVPNSVVKKVALRSMIEEPAFRNAKSKITVCIGLSVSGKPVYMNIDDMPHVLVAGQTKSGKSVAINCMIMSLIYRATPDEVQLLLIDPKRVELSIYNNIPHLIMPVIDDHKKAAAALKWAVDEMDRRYQLLNEAQVRNRDEYYQFRAENPKFEYMPQIVIIIDELADLMLQAREHVEDRINRLAAMARACGMHIIIGTQRPSVDVVTGLIKANIPSHIAFKVASQTDSRVILNVNGAEKLLGRGDMLYHETGKDIVRLQGAFVDTPEIKRVLNFIIENNGKAVYNPEVMYALQQETDKLNKAEKKGGDDEYATDCSDIDFELLCQATELVIQMGAGISKNVIQRHLKIGFNRSANIFDKLEELGFISPPQGNKPRDCTVTWEQYQQWKSNNGR